MNRNIDSDGMKIWEDDMMGSRLLSVGIITIILVLFFAFAIGATEPVVPPQQEKKIVVIRFSAGWCSPCQSMKRNVWSDPKMKKYFKDNKIEVYDIDIDKQKAYARQYNVSSIPCVVILERTSKDRAKEINRFVGMRSTKEVIKFVEGTRTGQMGYSKVNLGLLRTYRLIPGQSTVPGRLYVD